MLPGEGPFADDLYANGPTDTASQRLSVGRPGRVGRVGRPAVGG
jgi:hypothetical protein